jgi:hypothetical protein
LHATNTTSDRPSSEFDVDPSKRTETNKSTNPPAPPKEEPLITRLSFLLVVLLEGSTAKMQVPNPHTPDIPLLQLRLLNNIPSEKVRRVSNMLDSRQNIPQSNGRILLSPSERSRQPFVFCSRSVRSNNNSILHKRRESHLSLPAEADATQHNSPKKYSTNARSAVPASESPNAIIGAASSPRLNCSMVGVKV